MSSLSYFASGKSVNLKKIREKTQEKAAQEIAEEGNGLTKGTIQRYFKKMRCNFLEKLWVKKAREK